MLEEFFYNVNSEDAAALLEIINEDGTELNAYFLFTLDVIEHSLTLLKRDANSVIQVDAIKKLFGAYLIAEKVVALINERKEGINLTDSEVESLKINAESIVNGVEKIAEINKDHIVKTDSLTLLIYLAS